MSKLDDRAIRMYEEDLLSLQMIGEYFGVTRQGVKKYLNKRGVDTRKRLYEIECSVCGKRFSRNKAYIRNTYKPTCSVECYYKRIKNPEYNQNRQGQRVARKVADELLIADGKRLAPDNVVHHEDGNTENNDPKNLIVFRNHSDHMVWHRGDRSKVKPVLIGKYGLKSKKMSGHSEKYKEKNPNERCDFCGKAMQYCFC